MPSSRENVSPPRQPHRTSSATSRRRAHGGNEQSLLRSCYAADIDRRRFGVCQCARWGYVYFSCSVRGWCSIVWTGFFTLAFLLLCVIYFTPLSFGVSSLSNHSYHTPPIFFLFPHAKHLSFVTRFLTIYRQSPCCDMYCITMQRHA